ncbi:hypothetical protein YC2023_104174 [Brassica napus]
MRASVRGVAIFFIKPIELWNWPLTTAWLSTLYAPMMCNVVKIVNQELGERSLEKPDLFLDSAPRLSHSWIQMAGK